MEFLFEIAKQYGLFVALVVYVIWDSREQQKSSRQREDSYLAESKAREDKYIEREEKYIAVIQEMTTSIDGIQKDIASINNKLGGAN
ncbi:hypothetical protein F400_gp076 [Bacillus phage BCD7]|uniref:Holin n=1 Tax=Bacillus phage BCD7 TaxID=1136534 RepID=J9PTZ1_9CAUD|nr:hypothetical protein F400_gp076 [Bacillus phage BCD7]AEZ50523.1 hypothetical protein BCD7_0076 [Bacillus phage BCD7]